MYVYMYVCSTYVCMYVCMYVQSMKVEDSCLAQNMWSESADMKIGF